MTDINSRISVYTNVATAVMGTLQFDTLLLVDSEDIPLDSRYLITTPADYTTDLTASSAHRNWASIYFGQSVSPSRLILGRWASAPTSVYAVCSGFETTIATWALVTGGSLKVTTTTGADDVGTMDFASCKTLAQVAAVIDAKLTASSGAVCSVDALGRIIFTDADATGAGVRTCVLSAGTGGTDIYAAAYLNGADSYQVDGVDAESPATAFAAIRTVFDDFWNVSELGADDTQQRALAAAVEATKCKFCTLVNTHTDCDDATKTTDNAYLLSDLAYARTALIYTEHLDKYGYLDAAITGRTLSLVPGSIQWDWSKITGVYESGKALDGTSDSLSTTEQSALEAKNCNYCESVSGYKKIRMGRTTTGVPCNLIMGIDDMNSKIQSAIFTYFFNNDNPAFDEKTLSAIEGIVRTYLGLAVRAGIIIDTPDDPIVYSFPLASSFSAATKASGTMALTNCYRATLNYPVNSISVYGTFAV